MQSPILIVSQAIQTGWKLTKQNLGFLIVYQTVLYFFFMFFSEEMLKQLSENWPEYAAWRFLGFIFLSLVTMGFFDSCLLIASGTKMGFSHFNLLYRHWERVFSWIAAYFLFGIMLGAGLFFLILPGFYVIAKFGLFPFFILDKSLGPIDALKASAKTSEGIRMFLCFLFLACFGLGVLLSLLLFLFSLIGLNLVGLFIFVVGTFLVTPVIGLALATIYKRFSHLKEKNEV